MTIYKKNLLLLCMSIFNFSIFCSEKSAAIQKSDVDTLVADAEELSDYPQYTKLVYDYLQNMTQKTDILEKIVNDTSISEYYNLKDAMNEDKKRISQLMIRIEKNRATIKSMFTDNIKAKLDADDYRNPVMLAGIIVEHKAKKHKVAINKPIQDLLHAIHFAQQEDEK